MNAHSERSLKIAAITVFFTLILCVTFASTVYGAQDSVTLNITTPSNAESTIAPNRSFYVIGEIKGATIPDGSSLTVTLSKDGREVRHISTDIKANDDLNVTFEKLSYYGSDRNELKTSGMPDLINTTPFNNASEKCYFDDDSFSALLPGGSSGDQMNWVDEHGNAYNPLKKGTYKLETILTNGGTEIARDSKTITIGVSKDKILARFSPDFHMNYIKTWADKNGYRMYLDAFPGYWSQGSLFCEILPEWRYSDAAEYSEGMVHCVLYNISETSSSYSVELGSLQQQGVIDNPSRLTYYYYDMGEPELNGKTAKLVKMEHGEKVAFTRAEIVDSSIPDNEYDPSPTSGIASTDYNVSDGIKAQKAGQTIALYGVTAPIQLSKTDIAENGDNSYLFKNKIAKIHYDITGKNVDIDLDKDVTVLNRTIEGKQKASELEFRHCIPVDENMAGKTLQVHVTAYDKHGAKVYSGGSQVDPGKDKEHDRTDTDKTKPETVVTSADDLVPETGDEGLNPLWIVLLAISAAAIVVVVIRSRKH